MNFSTFLRNKYSILILGIATVIYLINISNKESVLPKNLTTTSVSNQKNDLGPVTASALKPFNSVQGKTLVQNAVAEKNNTEKTLETRVPWEELHQKWLEELKSFLVSISDRDGLRMFKAYAESREKYLNEGNKIGKKNQQLNAIKPLTRKQEDQLAVESSDNFKKSNEMNKKIFGQHYDAVKKLHKEFEESIQVYSRDMPISLDLSFED